MVLNKSVGIIVQSISSESSDDDFEIHSSRNSKRKSKKFRKSVIAVAQLEDTSVSTTNLQKQSKNVKLRQRDCARDRKFANLDFNCLVDAFENSYPRQRNKSSLRNNVDTIRPLTSPVKVIRHNSLHSIDSPRKLTSSSYNSPTPKKPNSLLLLPSSSESSVDFLYEAIFYPKRRSITIGPSGVAYDSSRETSSEDESDDGCCDDIEPVDVHWFHDLLRPYTCPPAPIVAPCSADSVNRADDEFLKSSLNSACVSTRPSDVLVTVGDVTAQISMTMMANLVNSLCSEDDRFSSPRVAVLQGMYRAFPEVRTSLLGLLLSQTEGRLERIRQSHSIAGREELDCNALGGRLISHDNCAFSRYSIGVQDDRAEQFISDGSSHQENVHSSSSSQELWCEEAGVGQWDRRIPTPRAVVHQSRDHETCLLEVVQFAAEFESGRCRVEGSSSASLRCASPRTPCPAKPSPHTPLRLLIELCLTILRGYGDRLGCSGDSTEKADVLTALLDTLQLLLNSAPAESVSVLCRGLLRHWPRGCGPREIAFSRALPILFRTACAPSPPPPPTPSHGSPTSPSTLAMSPHSPLAWGLSVVSVRRLLAKVVANVSSLHSRLSLESISIVSDDSVLHSLLLSEPFVGLLETLVEALRANRTHWNGPVRARSEEFFDAIVDGLT